MASAAEELLLAHMRSVREAIAEATRRADALQQQINTLSGRLSADPLPLPTNRQKLDGWSREEDQVLFDHYERIGAVGCQKLLPHRTNLAVRVRAARKLGLHCLPSAVKVWCSQCDAKVTRGQVASCKSTFCTAKAA